MSLTSRILVAIADMEARMSTSRLGGDFIERAHITFDCRTWFGLIASIVSACRCEWALIWAQGRGARGQGTNRSLRAAGKLSLSVGRRWTWEAADKMPSLFAAESLTHCNRGNGRRGHRITKKTLMRRENALNERLWAGLSLMNDWY